MLEQQDKYFSVATIALLMAFWWKEFIILLYYRKVETYVMTLHQDAQQALKMKIVSIYIIIAFFMLNIP